MLSQGIYRAARSIAPTVLTALLSVFLSFVVQAQTLSDRDYRNVGSLNEADQAVSQILEKCGESGQVVLYQMGDRLPEKLVWMIKRLSQRRVQVTVHRVTEEEMQGELRRLESGPVEFQELMTFTAERPRLTFRGLLDRGRLLISRLFGIQRMSDMSLWIPVPRQADIVRMDQTRGFYAGATAAGSMGLSLVTSYLKTGAPLKPSLIWPMITLGAWVGLNVSMFRSVGQVMSQGKSLQATPNGWRVLPNSPFFWSTSFLRSMITNAIVQISIAGPAAMVSVDGFRNNLDNSFWSVVSRSEIDKYIASKTPSLKDENGRIVIGPGQWTEKQAANINFWWNFSHGMVKNLHLIQFDPMMMTYVFGGLAAINLGFLVKEQLPAWIERMARFGKSMEVGVVECKTLLLVEKP